MELSTIEIMELKSWVGSVEADIANIQAQLSMAQCYIDKINKKLGYETTSEKKAKAARRS